MPGSRTPRPRGISGCIGEGQNRWPAVNRLDAGKPVQLAMLGWEPTHRTLLEDIAAGHYPGN